MKLQSGAPAAVSIDYLCVMSELPGANQKVDCNS